MRKIFICLIIGSLLLADCNKEFFTLKINNPIPFKDILSNLSYKCNLNLIIKDKEANNVINSNIDFVNIKDVSLKKLLDILFDNKNLFYELRGDKLIISFYKTKTFYINYISNSISGNSNLNDKDNKISSEYQFNFWDNLKSHIENLLKNVNNRYYKPPIIDKNSNTITITGTKNQLLAVKSYIDKLQKELNKEVLIDVKIYSVELSNSHKTGIDWSKLSLSLPSTSVPLKAKYILGSGSVFNSATFNTEAFLNFLAQYGNVNSVSNPKIATLNNQKAILSIGTTVYYKYISNIVTENNQPPTTEYKIDSKFVGILLDITPQISDKGYVILNINPKISAFRDLTQLNATNRDMPPDIKLTTLMSVVRLKNNQTLVLGGLITNDKSMSVNGVPILKEIPIIKYLFSSKEKISSKKELVFVITPHIIDFNKQKSLKDLGFSKLPSLSEIDE